MGIVAFYLLQRREDGTDKKEKSHISLEIVYVCETIYDGIKPKLNIVDFH